MEKKTTYGGSLEQEEVQQPLHKIGIRFESREVPLGEDGFVQSFSWDNVELFKKFYLEYGFVVVRGIYEKSDIDSSIKAMWDLIEHLKPGLKRDEPSTWQPWPGLSQLGLLSQALSDVAWSNRVNPKLYHVFRNIIGRDDLWVSVDNWGVMRPTRRIPQSSLPPAHNGLRTSAETSTSEVVEEKPEWKTKSKWLHWDLNPFMWVNKEEGLDYVFEGDFISENNGSKNDGYPKLQGLLNLIDARPSDGGFLIVPCFHHHLSQWTKQPHLQPFKKSERDNAEFVEVPLYDSMQDQTQKVPMKAGDFLIWSSEMPHQNFENNSERFRMVQYIKMFGVPPPGATGVDLRRRLMEKYSPKELQSNPLARKLLGLDPY